MAAAASDAIIIAGHSHVGAMFGGAAEEVCLSRLDGHDRFLGLYGPWPRTEDYWNALVENAPGNSVALVWDGNEHNTMFLIEQSSRFDFVPRSLEMLPVEEDAVLVPEALVRGKLQVPLDGLHYLLTILRTRTDRRIAVIGTPPPKGDNEYLRSVLATEFAGFEGTAGEVRLTSPLIRLKLWQVVQENHKEQAERDGAEFISVPDIVRDESGFLRPEFWGADVTHANPAYGQAMLEYLAASM